MSKKHEIGYKRFPIKDLGSKEPRPVSRCLGMDEYLQFLVRSLSAQSIEAIKEHLKTCDRCSRIDWTVRQTVKVAMVSH